MYDAFENAAWGWVKTSRLRNNVGRRALSKSFGNAVVLAKDTARLEEMRFGDDGTFMAMSCQCAMV